MPMGILFGEWKGDEGEGEGEESGAEKNGADKRGQNQKDNRKKTKMIGQVGGRMGIKHAKMGLNKVLRWMGKSNEKK